MEWIGTETGIGRMIGIGRLSWEEEEVDLEVVVGPRLPLAFC